ncbi:MAG: DegT/DnrJ/EryC1/StrS family aminotransferase, partial [Bacteroidota bacterium]
KLEKHLAKRCKRKFAMMTSSCTDALYFSLKAAGVGKGDEIPVTSFSFISSASCILRTGAIPVFTDIDPVSYMMDLSSLEKYISPQTKAIVAVHLNGQTLPFDKLREFAAKHKLSIIEDAAQALGASWNGEPAGSAGKISCLSFDPTKIVGGYGTAGAVLTDNPEYAEKIRMLRYHGRNNNREYETEGYNSHPSCWQAALIDMQLANLDQIISGRNRVAERYTKQLSAIGKIKLPVILPVNRHNFHKYIIRVEKRDDLKKHLTVHGIETMIHYPAPLSSQPVFKDFTSRFPLVNAEKAAKEVLSLPVYPELTDGEIDYICEKINEFYKN